MVTVEVDVNARASADRRTHPSLGPGLTPRRNHAADPIGWRPGGAKCRQTKVSAAWNVARGAAWIVVCVLVLALLARPGGRFGVPALADDGLLLAGSVENLEPGTQGVLALTVTNPRTTAVTVRRLSAEVTGGGSADCGVEHLAVDAWTGELSVPARGRAVAALPLRVAADDACRGQTWSLRYEAG
jgi:hypothetical protein